jgi:hypothetical protein
MCTSVRVEQIFTTFDFGEFKNVNFLQCSNSRIVELILIKFYMGGGILAPSVPLSRHSRTENPKQRQGAGIVTLCIYFLTCCIVLHV